MPGSDFKNLMPGLSDDFKTQYCKVPVILRSDTDSSDSRDKSKICDCPDTVYDRVSAIAPIVNHLLRQQF